VWDAAVVEARTRNLYSDDPYQPGWFDRVLLQQMEPPYKMKSKTRRPFEPAAIKPRRAVLETYLSMHSEVAHRLRSAEGVDLGAIKVKSPFVSWAKYSLGFSFLLFAAHERRHLWQAAKVKAAVPMPQESPITL
jgi:hypothetical protein